MLHSTKYCRDGVLMVSVYSTELKPLFGSIKNIWTIKGFIYFEVLLFTTLNFNEHFQSYAVELCSPEETFVCPYEHIVDYNVYHVKKNDNLMYIPLKYNVKDLLYEHTQDRNPFMK